jgi:hypothetical protein
VARRILSFTHPRRFVVGTVGEPGSRTFFLQVSDGEEPVSVVCEKDQASVLAEKVVELLDQVRRSGVDVGIGWDPADESVIIEAHAEYETDDVPDIGDDSDPGPDTLRVRMSAMDALAFSVRAGRVVSAGRPQCPFCHLPIDPDGHICPRANGYRRNVT